MIIFFSMPSSSVKCAGHRTNSWKRRSVRGSEENTREITRENTRANMKNSFGSVMAVAVMYLMMFAQNANAGASLRDRPSLSLPSIVRVHLLKDAETLLGEQYQPKLGKQFLKDALRKGQKAHNALAKFIKMAHPARYFKNQIERDIKTLKKTKVNAYGEFYDLLTGLHNQATIYNASAKSNKDKDKLSDDALKAYQNLLTEQKETYNKQIDELNKQIDELNNKRNEIAEAFEKHEQAYLSKMLTGLMGI